MLNLQKRAAVMWTFGVSIPSDTEDSDALLALARAETATMVVKLKSLAQDQGKLVDLVYMNYADVSQTPLESYGTRNLEYMRSVARRYDPEGWFQNMVPGGFKLGNF